MKKKKTNPEYRSRKWTQEEENLLIDQIRVFPQNLSKCFITVAQETNRTKLAVANHWYTVTSKSPQARCFFTASPKHMSMNRKNGMGTPITQSIWVRLLRVLGFK